MLPHHATLARKRFAELREAVYSIW